MVRRKRNRSAEETVELGATPVAVDWEDAWSNSTKYFSLKSIATEGPLIMRSVGIIIRNDEAGIALANDRPVEEADEDFRYIHFIPRAMVRKVTVLK